MCTFLYLVARKKIDQAGTLEDYQKIETPVYLKISG